MPDDRLEVSVPFDERGYIGSAAELRLPVMALSLGGLRRKVEALMMPDDVRVVLQLDGLAQPFSSPFSGRPCFAERKSARQAALTTARRFDPTWPGRTWKR